MWVSKFDSTAQLSPMIICYKRTGSEEYVYMTIEEIRFESITRLVSAAHGNELFKN